MSSVRNDYVIVGYDLTQFKDTICKEEWVENPENDKYWRNQEKGNIQVFNDPMCGDYLYFGYIIAANDEYDSDATTTLLTDLIRQKPLIDLRLSNMGWNIPESVIESKYQLISFSEYR